MITLLRFLVGNLAPSLLAGGLAWWLVRLLCRVTGLRDARFRLALYGLPLLKSTLVLLGIGVVLPWPPLLARWRALAVPWDVALPSALIWAGLTLIIQDAVRRRKYREILADAVPAAASLQQTLDEVIRACRQTRGWAQRLRAPFVAHPGRLPAALPLFLSLRAPAPVVLTTPGEEAVLLPASLPEQLAQKELAGVLAHEVAHLMVDRPGPLSPTWWSLLTPLSPVALLLDRELQREVEIACDAVAAELIKDPATYAQALIKSYRFAANAHRTGQTAWSAIAGLTGVRPLLTERVEELLRERSAIDAPWFQAAAGYLAWMATWALLF